MANNAESISREVEALFDELSRVTEERQTELTNLLRKVSEGQALNTFTEEQVRGLRAIFSEDAAALERRNSRANLGLALLGIVGGYALSLLAPAEDVRRWLFGG